jgi:hypothetical protein
LAEIIKVYTGEQLFELYRNYVLGKSDLTDFNDGSANKAILQSNSDIVSQIMMDFKEGIFQAIPVALYEGFGFKKKAATTSTGFIRPYRIPSFTMEYTGSGTSALITVSATDLVVPVVVAPADALNLDFATYPKTSDLVTFIDGETNWSATLLEDVDSDTLFQYSSVEIIGSLDYELNSGFDLMLQTDTAINILQGYSISIEDIAIITDADAVILAGSSGIQIAASASVTGTDGNIKAQAIDTRNGKGTINSQITGVDFVINDSAFAGGFPAETDAQRAVRFSETVNGLNAGTELGIISEIKKIDGVISAGMRVNYPFKGSNTVIVDDGSGVISPTLQASVEKVLAGDPNDITNFPGKEAKGIGYIIAAPTIVNVDIGITIKRLSSVTADLEDMKIDVQSAIEQYINTLPLGHDVILSEVSRVAKNSNAAVYDTDITSPLANIVIDEQEFARTGAGYTGVVTVTAIIITNP